MNNTHVKRTLLYVLLLQIGMQLTACQSLNQQGQESMDATARAEALRASMTQINEHEETIKALIDEAEQAMLSNDFEKAKTIYQDLLTYDANNSKAQEGLLAIEYSQKHLVLLQGAQQEIDAMNPENEIEKIAAAQEKLHQILLENPRHSQAMAMNQMLNAKQVKINQAKTVKKLAFNEPVTMEFRDVNIKQIFETLSKMTNINFILDKDIPSDQNATIFVKSVLFEDALDLLLQTNQLEKKVLSENVAIIYMNDVMHQKDYQELSVRSYTLEYADAKEMAKILRTMLNVNNVVIDPRLNTLIIKDRPEIFKLAEQMIYAQDKPDPEVMLELQVMEIKRSYLQDLGVQPPSGVRVPLSENGGLTVGDLRNVTGNSLVVNGIPGLIFNATDGDVSLLANPRIRVKNKQVAKIHIGEKVPVFTSNVASTGVASQSVQYIDAGLKLEVEPIISASDDVTIKLILNVGSIGDKVVAISGGAESVAYRIGTRMTSTELRLHDGETQVLAGLIDDQDRKNVSGIPGLYQLPLLGKLFSNQSDNNINTEIVLTITPHIVRPRERLSAEQAEIWVGADAKTGKVNRAPRFGKGGVMPFIVPKPPVIKPATNNETQVPSNLNIPLPSGFSLGNGLAPTNPEDGLYNDAPAN